MFKPDMSDRYYRPEIVSEGDSSIQAKMLVELHRCPICQIPMFPQKDPGIFPKFSELMGQAQRLRAGWETISKAYDGNRVPICLSCAKKDLATFICALCNKKRKSSEIEESVGDPPEHLCKLCYEHASAKTWNEKYEKLVDSHRYDWE